MSRTRANRLMQIPTSLWSSHLVGGLVQSGHQDALMVYIFLASSPWGHCSGLQTADPEGIGNALGMQVEHVHRCIEILADAGALTYDPLCDWIWLHDQALIQMGLNEKRVTISDRDLRVRGIVSQWNECPSTALRALFCHRYGRCLHVGPQIEGYEHLDDRKIRELHAEHIVGPSHLESAVGGI